MGLGPNSPYIIFFFYLFFINKFKENISQGEVFQKPPDPQSRSYFKRERHDSEIPFSYLSPQGSTFMLSPFCGIGSSFRRPSEDGIQGTPAINEYLKANRIIPGLCGMVTLGDPNISKNECIDDENEIMDMDPMLDEQGNFQLDRQGETENEKKAEFHQHIYSNDTPYNSKNAPPCRNQSLPHDHATSKFYYN